MGPALIKEPDPAINTPLFEKQWLTKKIGELAVDRRAAIDPQLSDIKRLTF